MLLVVDHLLCPVSSIVDVLLIVLPRAQLGGHSSMVNHPEAFVDYRDVLPAPPGLSNCFEAFRTRGWEPGLRASPRLRRPASPAPDPPRSSAGGGSDGAHSAIIARGGGAESSAPRLLVSMGLDFRNSSQAPRQGKHDAG